MILSLQRLRRTRNALLLTAFVILLPSAVVLWVRSYLLFDRIWYERRLVLEWRSECGYCCFGFGWRPVPWGDEDPRVNWFVTSGDCKSNWFVDFDSNPHAYGPEPGRKDSVRVANFGVEWDTRNGERYLELRVPYWLACTTMILIGWRAVIKSRRGRVAYRRASGLCLQCGYDLRASDARCPECGRLKE